MLLRRLTPQHASGAGFCRGMKTMPGYLIHPSAVIIIPTTPGD
jgi:hypothetical protein